MKISKHNCIFLLSVKSTLRSVKRAIHCDKGPHFDVSHFCFCNSASFIRLKFSPGRKCTAEQGANGISRLLKQKLAASDFTLQPLISTEAAAPPGVVVETAEEVLLRLKSPETKRGRKAAVFAQRINKKV